MKFIKDNERMQLLKMFALNQHPFYAEKMVDEVMYHIEIKNVVIGNIVLTTKPKIYIHTLMIKDKYRRKRYGTQVVNYFKKFKKEIKIHCDMNNCDAITFWLKMGFVRNEEGDLRLNPRETDKCFIWEFSEN